MKLKLDARDISGQNPLGLAIIHGSSRSMFLLVKYKEAVHLYTKQPKKAELFPQKFSSYLSSGFSSTINKIKKQQEEKDDDDEFSYINDEAWG